MFYKNELAFLIYKGGDLLKHAAAIKKRTNYYQTRRNNTHPSKKTSSVLIV